MRYFSYKNNALHDVRLFLRLGYISNIVWERCQNIYRIFAKLVNAETGAIFSIFIGKEKHCILCLLLLNQEWQSNICTDKSMLHNNKVCSWYNYSNDGNRVPDGTLFLKTDGTCCNNMHRTTFLFCILPPCKWCWRTVSLFREQSSHSSLPLPPTPTSHSTSPPPPPSLRPPTQRGSNTGGAHPCTVYSPACVGGLYPD